MPLVIVFFLSLMTCVVHAHSGGLASDGCHIDHSTGQRHCHRIAPVAAPAVSSGLYQPVMMLTASHSMARRSAQGVDAELSSHRAVEHDRAASTAHQLPSSLTP